LQLQAAMAAMAAMAAKGLEPPVSNLTHCSCFLFALSGPLFRFPITVLIPEPLPKADSANGSTNYNYQLVLSPGQVERRFLTIPENATWVDLSITGGNTYGSGDNGTNPRLYALHLQQVCEHEGKLNLLSR